MKTNFKLPILYFHFESFTMRVSIWLLLLFSCLHVTAQREAENWLFGYESQLTFTATGEVYSTTSPSRISIGGAACMSDKNGNLLFSSDGNVVYNRLNMEMPNGMFPTLNGSIVSGFQSAIAMPFPGHPSQYYLFYIDYFLTPRSDGFGYFRAPKLNYALIDMALNGGLGDVVSKNNLLLPADSVCMKITGTKHCNKKDYWLVGHLKNSDKYFSFLINENGIAATPVYSSGNLIFEDTIPKLNYATFNHLGFMKISPLGDKIAASYRGELDFVEQGDFNNKTGQISNIKKLKTKSGWEVPDTISSFGVPGLAGVEFSPSGKYLYVSANYYKNDRVGLLFQFDLTSNNETIIQQSRILLDSMVGTYELMLGMQLANNGKIYYISKYIGFLQIINNPEVAGIGCNITTLFANRAIQVTDLPNVLTSYLKYPILANGNCQFQNISFSILGLVGVNSTQWNFGDTATGNNNESNSFTPTHVFSSEGFYTVRVILQNTNGCGTDTIYKQIHAGPYKVFLGNDTSLCKGESLSLQINIPNSSILWSDSSTGSILKISKPGRYWVKVNLDECIATDTIDITQLDAPEFSLGPDSTICNNAFVKILPDTTYNNITYLWSNNSSAKSITIQAAGQYWLSLTGNNGCVWRDTIAVLYKKLPSFNLGSDTAICFSDTLTLDASVSGASSYLWNTGSSTSVIKIFSPSTYWCDVTKESCTYRDSIQVIVNPLPIVNLGKDTTLCETQTLKLSPVNPAASYLWQDNSTASIFLVSKDGTYSVSVIKAGCIVADTINVAYILKPRFSLGSDQLICQGQSIVLQPSNNENWLLRWQDGSSKSFIQITQPGLYSLMATNSCGSSNDQVLFTKGLCKVYVPNAFSPNGDTKNDVFKVYGTDALTDFHLQIFNRYGQLVFETTDKNKGWDGTVNNKPVVNGNYVYILQYKETGIAGQQVVRGSCLLIK